MHAERLLSMSTRLSFSIIKLQTKPSIILQRAHTRQLLRTSLLCQNSRLASTRQSQINFRQKRLQHTGIAQLGEGHRHKLHYTPLQSSTSGWAIGGAVIASVIVLGYSLVGTSEPQKEGTVLAETEDMSTKIPPGNVGNLTAEQEQKLREMWAIVFQLFGLTEAPPPTTLAVPQNTVNGADTSSRKRVSSLFSRKSAVVSPSPSDVQTSAAASAVLAGASSADGNDKHNLSKAFIAATSELSPTEIREAFWSMTKHDHPDALLLRFLRARKWDVRAAVIMAVSALHWRLVEAKVDSEIMIQGEQGMRALLTSQSATERKLGKDFIDQLEMGKSFLMGRDKEGRPCCYVRVRMHRAGEQSEESLERFTVWTIETARLMLNPPVSTAVSKSGRLSAMLMNLDHRF
jgi:CRAL/TRIO, N-terminal domain/CRAL/TRIO domain